MVYLTILGKNSLNLGAKSADGNVKLLPFCYRGACVYEQNEEAGTK